MTQEIPFNWDFNEVLKILRLRAGGKTWEVIAEEAHRAKSRVIEVYRWFQNLTWEEVSVFPEEIQRLRKDYLDKKAMELKIRLEESKQGQSKGVAGQGASAVELARARHWEELATLAGQLVTLREEYNIGHPVGGYDGYIIDDPLMIELPSGLLSSLSIHLKHEFPEFRNINNWKELLKIDTADELIIKLALVAHRRTLKGTCPFCTD